MRGHQLRQAQYRIELPTPTFPNLFARWASELVVDGAQIPVPVAEPHGLDWEAELAVIVGATTIDADENAAAENVFGYTVANDVSGREAQLQSTTLSTGQNEILEAYRAIFRTVAYRRVVPLRRFATEQFVFDDQIGHVTVVGIEMPNMPYPVGAELAVRLTHLFEMKDGKIVREIAYEMWREEGAVNAVDFIPPGSPEIVFAPA